MMRYSIKLFILLLVLSPGFHSCDKSSDLFTASGGGGNGVNGSLSRIISVGNYLYVVDDTHLKTINATNPASLQRSDDILVGSAIQTVYHNNGRIYIGSASTMYVYNIISNPAKPSLEAFFVYPPVLLARDPILAWDSVIYSTVVSGAGGGMLRIFNNTDTRNPQQVNTMGWMEPRGMDRVDTILYLCDGSAGLRLLSVKKPYQPLLLKTIDENTVLAGGQQSDNHYYDVIAIPPQLFCYTQGALLNYNISDPAAPVFLKKVN